MHKTMAPLASIAMAFLCAGIAGCGTQLPLGYHRSSLNSKDQPMGRVCSVSDRGCLSMMTESPRTCLTTTERCAMNGRVQPLDLPLDQTLDPIQYNSH